MESHSTRMPITATTLRASSILARANLSNSCAFFDIVHSQILAMAAERKLPAIYHHREYPLDGGLMSYGFDLRSVYTTLGSYVGKIFKGKAPSDLPVQRLDKFEFVINLGAAKVLSLQAPHALAVMPNELIE